MPGFIGMTELIVLGVVALLVFGPKRLPEMGRSLGHGLREFKDSVTGESKSADHEGNEARPVLAAGSASTTDVPACPREDATREDATADTPAGPAKA